MTRKGRAKEQREKRQQEISLLRQIPYFNTQRLFLFSRWWSSDTFAVVTGSNRGIGNEIARQLAVPGLTVVITSRDTARGQEAMTILQEEGLNVAFCQLGIVDVASIRSFAEWISKTYGGLDILVGSWVTFPRSYVSPFFFHFHRVIVTIIIIIFRVIIIIIVTVVISIINIQN